MTNKMPNGTIFMKYGEHEFVIRERAMSSQPGGNNRVKLFDAYHVLDGDGDDLKDVLMCTMRRTFETWTWEVSEVSSKDASVSHTKDREWTGMSPLEVLRHYLENYTEFGPPKESEKYCVLIGRLLIEVLHTVLRRDGNLYALSVKGSGTLFLITETRPQVFSMRSTLTKAQKTIPKMVPPDHEDFPTLILSFLQEELALCENAVSILAPVLLPEI
jgi:hypothetical protein